MGRKLRQNRHAERAHPAGDPRAFAELGELETEEAPGPTAEYPFVVSAGERRSFTANTIIRNPEWRKKDRGCALRMHPEDARRASASPPAAGPASPPAAAAKCASIAAGAEQKLRAGNVENLTVNADALLVRCLARQGDLEPAREKVAALRGLEADDFRSEYGRQLAIAQFDAADGRAGPGLTVLGQLAAKAKKAGHLLFELEILLTLGEIELAHGRQAAGRERLEQLAARAKSLGAGQIQRRAQAAFTGG